MERDCKTCVYAGPFGGEYDNRCTVWSCEYINRDEAAEAYRQTRWIPVTVRLPETDKMMLVSCRTKKGTASVNRAYYDGTSWHGSGSMSGVVAWMPLPEPYGEGAK